MYAEEKIREAQARGDHAAVEYWRHVKAAVDEAPPLTAEQQARLRPLLAPAVRTVAQRRAETTGEQEPLPRRKRTQ